MSSSSVLAEIKRLARLRRIMFRMHARERMASRGATAGDVREALITATAAHWQADRETWRVAGGVDLDGDELVVIAALEADVVVVTVF